MGRFLRTVRRVALVALLVAVVAGVVLFLSQNRYWPFATGTDVKAFLGATFGMSPPEVERATGRRLLTYEEYRRAVSEPLFQTPSGPLGYRFESHDPQFVGNESSLYTGPFTFLDIRCEVRFSFFDEQLESVVLAFKAQPATQDEENLRILRKFEGLLDHDFEVVLKDQEFTKPRLEYRRGPVDVLLAAQDVGMSEGRVDRMAKWLRKGSPPSPLTPAVGIGVTWTDGPRQKLAARFKAALDNAFK